MDKEVGAHDQSPTEQPGALPLPAGPRKWRQLAVVLFTTVCTVGLLAVLKTTPPNGQANPADRDSQAASGTPHGGAALFADWNRSGTPVVVLMLSGEELGYLDKCGCSHPQYGGLPRRYNFLQSLKQNGWPVVALDLGDIPQKDSGPQKALKYATSMKALDLMNYSAVGVEAQELAMPLIGALAEYRLNNPTPKVLAANILTTGTSPVIKDLVQGWHIVDTKNQKIGVVGMVGPSVSKKVNDAMIQFSKENGTVILDNLRQLKKKNVQLTVLLYQGDLDEARACARFCAQERRKDTKLAELNVILCISPFDPAPKSPQVDADAPNTTIIAIGNKGREIGVVGVFRSPKAGHGYEMKYELVSIGPEYDTPEGKGNTNPVLALMEDYAKQVKNENFILKYPTVPHLVQVNFKNAKYVGSERCAGCHQHAHDIWDKTGHATAFKALVNARRPSLRQFDGECVVCHTIGFDHLTGYADALRAGNERLVKKLENVGCESCHGPCSEHVKDTGDLQVRAAINPFKTQPNESPQQKAKRLLKLNLFCQECHNADNDVHWNFEKNWPKIVHMTPKNSAAQQPAGNGNPPIEAQPAGEIVPPVEHAPVDDGFVPETVFPPTPGGPPMTETPEQRRFFLNPFRWFPRKQ